MAAALQPERAGLVVNELVDRTPQVPMASTSTQLPNSDSDGTASSLQRDPTQPVAGLHWTVLPQLPTPKYATMHKQSAIGCAVVIGTIVACLGATHAAVWLGELPDPWHTAFVGTIWAETTVALGCLLGLMFGDPGVVKRSEERCDPVPGGLIRTTLV